VHTPLWQSVGCVQALLGAHAGQVGPPQSVSVSLPFFTPSKQLEGWQTEPVQTLLWQSLGSAQVLLSAQAGQVEPPQSVSVSLPFFTTSVQLGG
jgi:hypothetical protein